MQQVLAFESDLLEYDDIFDGSHVIEAKVADLVDGATAEIARIAELGGAVAAIESGYMKQELVRSHAERRARIEAGDDIVVGVNAFVETEPSPLTSEVDGSVQVADPDAEQSACRSVAAWQADRDDSEVATALQRLGDDATSGVNLMPATLAAARAGATTGEWAGVLREVFGEYRAPTGVSGVVAAPVLMTSWPPYVSPCGALVTSSADGCDCSSPSPDWTGTATGRSRSPYAHGTRGSR